MNDDRIQKLEECVGALEDLLKRFMTVLKPKAHQAFMGVLDATEPTPALVELMQQHDV